MFLGTLSAGRRRSMQRLACPSYPKQRCGLSKLRGRSQTDPSTQCAKPDQREGAPSNEIRVDAPTRTQDSQRLRPGRLKSPISTHAVLRPAAPISGDRRTSNGQEHEKNCDDDKAAHINHPTLNLASCNPPKVRAWDRDRKMSNAAVPRVSRSTSAEIVADRTRSVGLRFHSIQNFASPSDRLAPTLSTCARSARVHPDRPSRPRSRTAAGSRCRSRGCRRRRRFRP